MQIMTRDHMSYSQPVTNQFLAQVPKPQPKILWHPARVTLSYLLFLDLGTFLDSANCLTKNTLL